MRKLRILGKEIPVILVASILLASAGSAAVLTYYGQITTTVNVYQSILLDGKDVNSGSLTISHQFTNAPGGERFCYEHKVKNQMSVPGKIDLQTAYNPALTDSEIITTYSSTVTDATPNPITDFGKTENEVCGELPISLTLNQIFSDSTNGFRYWYTVVNGGTYNGASPIVAVLNLADGRHVVLFPGWGTRTNGNQFNLKFSDTVVTSSADSGNVPVDFTVYSSSWSQLWSSNGCPSYPSWNGIKSSCAVNTGAGLIIGTESVVSISFQHQAANTGEQERLDEFAFATEDSKFNPQIAENTPFTLQPGQETAFCLCYAFAQNIAPGQYAIVTNVNPQ